MTLTELRCLVAIVDAGLNMSAAAEVMHASQPSLSRHLKQIESTLGFQIFARHGRQLAGVTPAGQRVVESARRIVCEVESLRCYAANQRGDITGDLHITAPETYSRHVLPTVLAKLVERYPDMSVRLHPVGEGEPIRPADRNNADLVLLSTAGDDVPEGVAVPLFRWRRVVLVPIGHPLAPGRHTVELATLAKWPLVTYEASRLPRSTFREAMKARGLEPHFACSAQDAGLIKAYVRAGLGVGLVAELAVTAADHEHFVVLPADPVIPDCTAWAILPEGRVLRDPVVELILLLAPQLDAVDIRRASEGMQPEAWKTPTAYAAAD